jgi:hypothetical protein
MDGPMAQMIQQDIELRLEKLKTLELKEMQANSTSTVSPEVIELITCFLSDLRSQWDRLPLTYQSRLFKLLLSEVIIHTLEDGNLQVDIHWRGGLVEQLLIERSPVSTECKAWTEEEKNVFRASYPTASVEEVMSHFPDHNWELSVHLLNVWISIRCGFVLPFFQPERSWSAFQILTAERL